MNFPDEHKTVETGVSGSLQSLLGTVVIAVFVITFIVQALQIPSPSMENTLLIGDYLLVNKLCYGSGGLGDYLMPFRQGSGGHRELLPCSVTPPAYAGRRARGVAPRREGPGTGSAGR